MATKKPKAPAAPSLFLVPVTLTRVVYVGVVAKNAAAAKKLALSEGGLDVIGDNHNDAAIDDFGPEAAAPVAVTKRADVEKVKKKKGAVVIDTLVYADIDAQQAALKAVATANNPEGDPNGTNINTDDVDGFLDVAFPAK